MMSNDVLPGCTRIPFTRALLLDPWLEPIPSPGPLPLNKTVTAANGGNTSTSDEASSVTKTIAEDTPPHPSILVINSEVFTLWKDHFARLQEVVAAWDAEGKRIITLGQSILI